MWIDKFIDKTAIKQYEKERKNKKSGFISEVESEPKKVELPTHNEQGQAIIRNLSKYRDLLKEGQTEFDFSELDMNFANIQQIDLSNLGLNINLQKIFFPFYGSINNNLNPVDFLGDDFVWLNKSNLKGNNVTGELTNAVDSKRRYSRICTFIYSDDTFDDEYKNSHPQYFLDADAPSELREKFYTPFERTENTSTLYDIEGKEEKTVYYRQPLSFEEYLQYYQFLQGKYIDRFRIKKLDYSKIKLVETLGLEQTRQTIESLKNSNVDPALFFSSIGSMTSEEIKTSILGDNEQQSVELLEQIDTTIKAKAKVL